MIPSLLATLIATTPAHACGGFFCSSGGATTSTTGTTTSTGTVGYGLVPVVQSGERILFRRNKDDTITTFVEVGFQQREDVEFAWIIPIPDVIDVSRVETTDAELFNELELATAPSFTFQWTQTNQVRNYNYTYGYGYYGSPGGCSTMGCSSSAYGDIQRGTRDSGMTLSTVTTPVEETSGVAVVQDAVVGPFAIEVITAVDGLEFADWLETSGYDLPQGAVAPLQHYIDQGMAFLGVKLAPDVPEGPIDTLSFTCPAEDPTIPLILTSIASADDLDITAYVLAEDYHVPINWMLTRDFAAETLPLGGGQTDYLARMQAETGVYDGQAFVLEYAGLTSELQLTDPIASATVHQYPRLVRLRGQISPHEMTLDPIFGPFPGLDAYPREHVVAIDEPPPAVQRRRSRGPRRDSVNAWFRQSQGAWLFLAPLALLGLLGRRRP